MGIPAQEKLPELRRPRTKVRSKCNYGGSSQSATPTQQPILHSNTEAFEIASVLSSCVYTCPWAKLLKLAIDGGREALAVKMNVQYLSAHRLSRLG